MKSDEELDMWKQYWQAQPSVPQDLFKKVEKENTHLRYYRVAEVLVTVLIGGGTAAAALVTRNVHWTVLAAGTWVFIVVAWFASLRYTRGVWAPGAPTTAAYLDLSIRRCQWRMKDARYNSVQSVLLTAFVLVVDYYILLDMSQRPPSLWLLAIAFIVISPGLVVGFERARRKAKTELDSLVDLQRQLQESN
jgi:hypothetical protein